MRMWKLSCAAGAVLAISGLSLAEEITVESAADNTLFEDPTGSLSAGAEPAIFAGSDGRGMLKRALIRFDLSGIPAGAVVTEVELTLTLTKSASLSAQEVGIHRVLADWGEGTSLAPRGGGIGGPATDGDATWLHTFFPTDFWATPGGDFEAAASATQMVGPSLMAYAWTSDALAGDVQAWIDDPDSNYGWMVRCNEVTAATAEQFGSKESVAARRPMLRVVFDGGCPADCDGSGELDFFDFLCFQNLFGMGDPGADCDGTGTLDFFDFLCFQNQFAMGCS
ncbi:MAG: DNRLRE domain-containing protein [Phycisphaerales bacterium JB039]